MENQMNRIKIMFMTGLVLGLIGMIAMGVIGYNR